MPLRDLADLRGAADGEDFAAGLARDLVDDLARLEVGQRDVDRDEVDRRARRARVAQQRVVLDVRAVVVAVGHDDERLSSLERAELVEPEDDGVVERGRSLRPQVLRGALQGQRIAGQLLQELGAVAELEHEALVLRAHQVPEQLRATPRARTASPFPSSRSRR